MFFSGNTFALSAAALLMGATIAVAQMPPQTAPKTPAMSGKPGKPSAAQPDATKQEGEASPDPAAAGNAASAPPPGAPGQHLAPAVAETQKPPLELTGCRPVEDIVDRDGDFQRNLAELSTNDLCLKMDVFHEGGQTWILQIIQHKLDPGRILWFVPHDNENDAFDSAVYGLKRYHGTIVAVETGGTRFNGRQDPNRNFQIENATTRCRDQVAPSPIYTERVLRWHKGNALIFALHTNERGYAGDGHGGAGGISIAKPLPGNIPFRAQGHAPGLSPDDTVVFLASTAPPQADRNLMTFVQTLQQNQINVLYETVSATHNDCSLSNYAALSGQRDYINLEVVQSDGQTQRMLVDRILDLLPPGGIGPLLPAAPMAQDGKGVAAAANQVEPGRQPGSGQPGPDQPGPSPQSTPNSQPPMPGAQPSPDRAPPAAQAEPPVAAAQAGQPPAAPAGNSFVDRFDQSSVGRPPAPQTQRPAAGPAVAVNQPPAAPPEAAPQRFGFTVQLAAPLTEEEAQSQWEQLRQRYPVLADATPSFTRATVNGKVHVRILVGPYESKAAATSLCKQLQLNPCIAHDVSK